MKDLQAEKIKLIYEFNNDSPLFARVAYSEIEKGNYLEAIKILDDGIHKHGNYPTAFLILSIAKAYAGKEEEAKIVAKIGSDLIDSPSTFEIYSKKIQDILTERISINETMRPAFHEEESVLIPKEKPEVIEDKLDELAKQLSKAKIIPRNDIEANPESVPHFNGKKIVSETLADIHYAQRNYEEATRMYEELIIKKPEKADIYLQKIAEMKSLV